MFTYNDSRLHDRVEVLIGQDHRIELNRVGETTQFVAPISKVKYLRKLSSPYTFIVDGKKVSHNLHDQMSNSHRSAQKNYWNGTPYIQVSSAPRPTTAERLVYIIPGNPGLCEFYADFAESLADLVLNSLIVSASHLGFNPDVVTNQSQRVYTLDEQVEHAIKFLKYFRSSFASQAKVYLLGHSVGAWITQRVATRCPEVVFSGLLTPTIQDIALSERGQKFTQLTKYVGEKVTYFTVWAVKWVPFYQLLIVKLLAYWLPVTEINGLARDASLGVALNPQVCQQVVGMAMEEMHRIGNDIEPSDISGFWENPHQRIWVCFADNDHWVSQKTREELIECVRRLPHALTETLPVPHSFVLRDSDAVAALAARQILK